jgi:hypothetical protein
MQRTGFRRSAWLTSRDRGGALNTENHSRPEDRPVGTRWAGLGDESPAQSGRRDPSLCNETDASESGTRERTASFALRSALNVRKFSSIDRPRSPGAGCVRKQWGAGALSPNPSAYEGASVRKLTRWIAAHRRKKADVRAPSRRRSLRARTPHAL